ncbi:mitochondrial carrier protein precursor [Gracilaria domingensis]|nr:mitochondrial carrier protein precursor [Gracilaria domingensis]
MRHCCLGTLEARADTPPNTQARTASRTATTRAELSGGSHGSRPATCRARIGPDISQNLRAVRQPQLTDPPKSSALGASPQLAAPRALRVRAHERIRPQLRVRRRRRRAATAFVVPARRLNMRFGERLTREYAFLNAAPLDALSCSRVRARSRQRDAAVLPGRQRRVRVSVKRPRVRCELGEWRDERCDDGTLQPAMKDEQSVSTDVRETPLSSASEPSRSLSRRTFIALAAVVALTALPAPPPTNAIELAPTPINPYARRRRERAYQRYAEQIEQSLEKVAVADFEKVVKAGGGGISVSYRIAGFAAFVASAISTAVVHPIDSIKTRLQARAARLTEAEPNLFENLYKGIFSNILKEAPNAAIYLGVYELCKSILTNLSFTSFFQELPLLTFMVAGALGDAIGSVVRVPAEIVNKRLQIGVNSNWSSALRDAFLTPSGRKASVVAWQAVLLRDVPYGGLQIMLYEFGKLMLVSHPHLFNGYFSQGGVMADVFVGATAGALAAMITTPADVLVTRLSVREASAKQDAASPGILATARHILTTEGPVGFFRGTLQRGVYYAPLIGLFFALYEFSRQSLSDPNAAIASVMNAERIVLADWSALPAQLSHAYQTIMPYLTAFVWLISDQLPLILSFASVNGGQV